MLATLRNVFMEVTKKPFRSRLLLFGLKTSPSSKACATIVRILFLVLHGCEADGESDP